jgi:hypothetical protein
MTVTATTVEEPQYVTFFAGGDKGKRPILSGANLKPTFDKIPIVDFSNINSPSLEEQKKLSLGVRRAFTDVGFCMLRIMEFLSLCRLRS